MGTVQGRSLEAGAGGGKRPLIDETRGGEEMERPPNRRDSACGEWGLKTSVRVPLLMRTVYCVLDDFARFTDPYLAGGD
jgi:hypothetical protein